MDTQRIGIVLGGADGIGSAYERFPGIVLLKASSLLEAFFFLRLTIREEMV